MCIWKSIRHGGRDFKGRRMVKAFFAGAVVPVALIFGLPQAYADCTLTNTDRTPLNDLGPGLYEGFAGGLYPNGTNTRPPAHEAAGLDIALNQIQPLDANGSNDVSNGKVVMISIGMSNTTDEFGSDGSFS